MQTRKELLFLFLLLLSFLQPKAQKDSIKYSIYFTPGSSVVSESEKIKIRGLISSINDSIERISLNGYTDNTGSIASNRVLATDRAWNTRGFISTIMIKK